MVALRTLRAEDEISLMGKPNNERKRSAFSDLTNLSRATTYGSKAQETNVPDTRSLGDQKGGLQYGDQQKYMLKAQETRVVEERRPSLSEPRVHVSDVDLADAQNVQSVAEYASDIHEYLLVRQKDFKVADYMAVQESLTPKMRAVLTDWLVEVHWKFKLQEVTLFLAVALLDRYLAKVPVRRAQLQLVGVTCMLIAAKHEEIYPPEVKALVRVTDDTYTRAMILDMEVAILTSLEFVVTIPSPLLFFNRLMKVQGTVVAPTSELPAQIALVQYILELTLGAYDFIKYDPSHLAAAALFLSNKILKVQPAWSPVVAEASYSDTHIKSCAKAMCSLLQGAEKSSLQSVRKKFSHSQYHRVAKLVA